MSNYQQMATADLFAELSVCDFAAWQARQHYELAVDGIFYLDLIRLYQSTRKQVVDELERRRRMAQLPSGPRLGINPKHVQQVKSRANIVRVFAQLTGQALPNRQHVMARCPWGPDHSPSFSLSADKNLYHCFAHAEHSGDVLGLVRALKQSSFVDAFRWLEASC